MNQILSTNMPMDNNRNKKVKEKKYKNKGTIDSRGIIKFFAMAILIFGIVMVGTGAYAIYRNQVEQQGEKLEPSIVLENRTDTTLLLRVTHSVNIVRVRYRWNDGEETVINGKDGKYLEQEIAIPAGTNTLNIVVEDENGEQSSYSREYVLDSNINIEVVGNKIKITYAGDKTISYMTYRWDEEDETRVDINNTSIDQEIEAKRGDHTLTVVVVDVNNKTETKVQKTRVVSKPVINISVNADQTRYVINLTDESELQEVVVTLNDDENQRFGQKLSGQEFQFEMPINEGSDNMMEVVVTNSEGVEATARVKFPK